MSNLTDDQKVYQNFDLVPESNLIKFKGHGKLASLIEKKDLIYVLRIAEGLQVSWNDANGEIYMKLIKKDEASEDDKWRFNSKAGIFDTNFNILKSLY